MRRTAGPAAAALLLALLCGGPVPRAGADPATLDEIVAALVASSGLKAHTVAVSVVDPRDGTVLADHRGREPMTPASCMKVATTAAALTTLGPDHLLRTRLLAVPPARGGDPSVVPGDLWLVGGGDPGLSEHGPEGSTLAALDGFAAQVPAKGIRTVRGDLVLDASWFDGPRVHSTWTDVGPAARWYAAEVDALTVNDACVDVTVEPGPGGGRISLFPETGLVPVVNRVAVTASRKEHGFGFLLSAEGNTLQVSGKVWTKSAGATLPAAIHDPALLCAEQVGRALARAGVRVTGVIRRPRDGEAAPGGAALLAEHGTPLSLACAVANTRSQNLWAETLLRVMGAERKGEGSFEKGALAVQEALRPAGAEVAADLRVVDGSGLSRVNEASALSLARILAHAWRSGARDAYFGGFARPGTGTLDDRFREKRFEGRVFAKTGTLTRVSGLAGLALGPGDRPFCFAVLGDGVDVSRARRLQDAVVSALAGGR